MSCSELLRLPGKAFKLVYAQPLIWIAMTSDGATNASDTVCPKSRVEHPPIVRANQPQLQYALGAWRGAVNAAIHSSALLLLDNDELLKDVATFSRLCGFSFIYYACYPALSLYFAVPMDGLSVAASIIAVLQLTHTVIRYLDDVKDASADRTRCALEAANLYSLLVNLKFRLEGTSNEPWHTAVRALNVENGPLDQYKHELKRLQTKITNGSGIKKIGNTLLWRFIKEDVISILSRMERLKTLVQIALEMDHL